MSRKSIINDKINSTDTKVKGFFMKTRKAEELTTIYTKAKPFLAIADEFTLKSRTCRERDSRCQPP